MRVRDYRPLPPSAARSRSATTAVSSSLMQLTTTRSEPSSAPTQMRGLSASTSAQSCVHFALAAAHVLSQGAVDVRLVAAPAVLARFEP